MKTRLGELLVQQGILKEEDLERFLDKQRTSKKRLGELLVEAKAVTKTDLVQILSSQLGIPYLDLETSVIEPAALAFPGGLCPQVHLHSGQPQ